MSQPLLPFMSAHKSGGIVLSVRAKPTGKRNRIIDITSPALQIELAAKPHDGEANAELIDYMSDVLRVKKKDLQLISGGKSRDKQLLINSGLLNVDELKAKIEKELDD